MAGSEIRLLLGVTICLYLLVCCCTQLISATDEDWTEEQNDEYGVDKKNAHLFTSRLLSGLQSGFKERRNANLFTQRLLNSMRHDFGRDKRNANLFTQRILSNYLKGYKRMRESREYEPVGALGED